MATRITKAAATTSDQILNRVRDVCFAFAGVEEKTSHGAPFFHVRGKGFLMFADDHHQDRRVGVWVKSTHEEQQRLVAEDPDRHFVPPYVGVKGWVGVRLDGRGADYIGLAILVEAAWLSVAPKTYVENPGAAPRVKRTSAPLVKTDPKVAAAALARVDALCAALEGTEREVSKREATFRAKKKPYAYFLDNHHRDGIISVCVRVSMAERARLIAKEPARYYSPSYIGHRGWIGVRLDAGKVDWKDVEARLRASHASVAMTKAKKRA